MMKSKPATLANRRPVRRGRGTRSIQWSRAAETSEMRTNRLWRNVRDSAPESGAWSKAANNPVSSSGCFASISFAIRRGSLKQRLQKKIPTEAANKTTASAGARIRTGTLFFQSSQPMRRPSHQVMARPPWKRWRLRRAAMSRRMACSLSIMAWRELDAWWRGRPRRFPRGRSRRRRPAPTSRSAGDVPVQCWKSRPGFRRIAP